MKIKIIDLERLLPEKLCITAHWVATKTEGDYSATAYGSIELERKEPSDPEFIPYEEITEEQAIVWVKEAMGEEKLHGLEESLAKQIEEQKTPKVIHGVPWSNE